MKALPILCLSVLSLSPAWAPEGFEQTPTKKPCQETFNQQSMCHYKNAKDLETEIHGIGAPPTGITIANHHAGETTAGFSHAGTFALRLTADDGKPSENAGVPITGNAKPVVSVPDLRGVWDGSGNGTLTNCQNPANNGPGTVPATLLIPNQTGATFSGSGSFRLNLSDGVFNIKFSFTGILTSAGAFTASGPFESRRLSDNAFGGSGVGNFAGTISGNDLTFNQFDATTTVGDTCQLTASASFTRTGSVPIRLPIPINDPHDLNGDGNGDLLWQNVHSKIVGIWLMNGTNIASSAFLGGVPAQWEIKGLGDVNGDGQADVVWENSLSHIVAVWFMNGLKIGSIGFPGGVSSAWNVEAVGDTNGDGKADLVWVNAQTGQVTIWLMNGPVVASSGVLSPVGGDWSNWHMDGIGDVDGNGTGDVIWHNTVTGQVTVWLMEGLTISSVGFPGTPPTNWEIAGLGDIDGNETSDLVWRNTLSGVVAVWFMNGGTIGSLGFPAGVPLKWQLEQVADINSDGKSDVIWRNTTTGTVAVWLMNGGTITGVGFPGNAPPEWNIQP
ncbi:MAG TPA: VCBS repeat-containing protein [Nitrospirales bacterium]|nr:VCBS repeat-containing protein [Nitrospirales bacterium]